MKRKRKIDDENNSKWYNLANAKQKFDDYPKKESRNRYSCGQQ
jgi:hypothetical protein